MEPKTKSIKNEWLLQKLKNIKTYGSQYSVQEYISLGSFKEKESIIHNGL
jgi:hypothetical protein